MSDPARNTVDQERKVAAAVRLSVVEGPAIGQEFKIEGVATIGRSPEASVMVDDPGVSRLHARIRRGDAGFEVEDLGSKNGTFLNGSRIEHALANLGDRIRVGPRVVLTLSTFDVVEEQIVQRQRLETVGRLGAGIAHDLNNVLAALHAGTAFLQQLPGTTELQDARIQECLRDLGLATSQGAELTRGILRIVRGRRSGLREPVDLGELVLEVTRILRHTIDHSITMQTSVRPDVMVHGNHSELQQILLNLCLNARDAMPQGGQLEVRVGVAPPPPELGLDPSRPHALLEVSDSGIGIDAETQARIFEPFFTTKREGAGFGIGLSTVRDLVRLHGGRITLESVRNRGSVFRLYFPAVDVQSFATTGERAALETPLFTELPSLPSHPISLLFVDDEQLLRRSFGRLLRQHGFLVTEAAGGSEALELYASGQHDVVILDLDMPGMSGEQAQLELLQRSPEARVMFASGHADPTREATVRERGARAFLQKPYEIEALIATIHEIVKDDAFREERTLSGRRS